MNGRALAAWSAAALLIVLGSANPLTRGLVLAASVNLLVSRTAPGRSLRPILAGVGLAAFAALALNLLLVHVGRTVILTIPDAIPLLGGRLTLESAAFGLTAGLGLAAAILAVAPLSIVLEPHELIDALPAPLERSGVAVATALNLLPALRRSAVGVIEAQRLRGERSHGLALWREVLVPVMLTSIESSLQLAEAMEARAFGSGRRTRWAADRLDRIGLLTLGCAVAAFLLAIAGGATGGALDWQTYPDLIAPTISPLVLAACLVLAVPTLPLWTRPLAEQSADGDG